MKTFKKIALFAVLVGVVLALSGCVLILTPEGSIRVDNGSTSTIQYVQIRPEGGSWGPDILGSELLSPGEEITDSGYSPGFYEVFIDFVNPAVFDEYVPIEVIAGETATVLITD